MFKMLNTINEVIIYMMGNGKNMFLNRLEQPTILLKSNHLTVHDLVVASYSFMNSQVKAIGLKNWKSLFAINLLWMSNFRVWAKAGMLEVRIMCFQRSHLCLFIVNLWTILLTVQGSCLVQSRFYYHRINKGQ